MPYASVEDLSPVLRLHLPHHAQEIYIAAFNSAWEEYAGLGREKQEDIARKVAWAAVKRRYHKRGNEWVEN
jgi:cation transport regulator